MRDGSRLDDLLVGGAVGLLFGLVVSYDYRALKKASLSETTREKIQLLEATRGG